MSWGWVLEDQADGSMNLLYTATKADIGASIKFGRAALGLMVAWAFNYLSVFDRATGLARHSKLSRSRYMIPSEPNNHYEHALRRSWFSGVCFSM